MHTGEVFSIGFEGDIGSSGSRCRRAKCQQHFAETGNLRELSKHCYEINCSMMQEVDAAEQSVSSISLRLEI